MSDSPSVGLCHACGVALKTTYQAFALQHHTIDYTFRGDTPNEQAHLTLASTYIVARFCSSQCCKPGLGSLLQAQRLSAALEYNQIQAGPRHPCAKCGKPVNMTQPHSAWVRCELTAEWNGSLWQAMAPDWFIVLAVMCPDCAGLASDAEDARQPDRQRLRV
ncbi:hypothetical protein H0A65_17050 [Alcaligenaceae bacterium]|nr:hypothetical protein [Alcaligenaceae bacterium]